MAEEIGSSGGTTPNWRDKSGDSKNPDEVLDKHNEAIHDPTNATSSSLRTEKTNSETERPISTVHQPNNDPLKVKLNSRSANVAAKEALKSLQDNPLE